MNDWNGPKLFSLKGCDLPAISGQYSPGQSEAPPWVLGKRTQEP
jgi:hypothetical protein